MGMSTAPRPTNKTAAAPTSMMPVMAGNFRLCVARPAKCHTGAQTASAATAATQARNIADHAPGRILCDMQSCNLQRELAGPGRTRAAVAAPLVARQRHSQPAVPAAGTGTEDMESKVSITGDHLKRLVQAFLQPVPPVPPAAVARRALAAQANRSSLPFRGVEVWCKAVVAVVSFSYWMLGPGLISHAHERSPTCRHQQGGLWHSAEQEEAGERSSAQKAITSNLQYISSQTLVNYSNRSRSALCRAGRAAACWRRRRPRRAC